MKKGRACAKIVPVTMARLPRAQKTALLPGTVNAGLEAERSLELLCP
jgi:antitoxin (DNA-binding transcriptional repressor) of toxin-antitoxin stability system